MATQSYYTSAPTGYMGARAALYTAAGTLVTVSNWRFNEQPMMGFVQGTALMHPISGYLQKEDLYGEMPKTPEEAVAMNRKPGNISKIPLHAVDGKTVIGTFNISQGPVDTITAQPASN